MPARRHLALLCALAALAGPASGVAAAAESLAASLDELGRGVGIEPADSPGVELAGRVDRPVVAVSQPAPRAVRPDRARARLSATPDRLPTVRRRLALLQVYRC